MLYKWFFKKSKPVDMNKYLIVGLGNIGSEYDNTRHNIGFKVIDELSDQFEVEMTEAKLGQKGSKNHKGRKLIFLKPSTFMNRSGKAVRYWALKENIPLENILIITDDLHLPIGNLRLKGKGSDGGHNGLKDIQTHLNTPVYARLRFGIKSEKSTFNQIDFVLGKFSPEEITSVAPSIKRCIEIIFFFSFAGLENTMNNFNGKKD